MKKEILYVGNLYNNNGPSIVNKNLYKNLKNRIYFLEEKKALKKIFEFKKKESGIKLINLSGLSLFNCLVAIYCTIKRKKISYLMHGAIWIENKYSNYSIQYKIYEKIILNLSSKIIVVSNNYKEILKLEKKYNCFINKIIVIPNGVEWLQGNLLEKKKKRILSIGGGRKEKNILEICENISLLNDPEIELIIIGKDGKDTDNIKKYKFVKYLGVIPQEEVFQEMEKAQLYIQNSFYESFGLSVLEALNRNCSLLLSSNIGVLDFFSEKIKEEIIVNQNNFQEKLKEVLSKDNYKIIQENFDEKKFSWERIGDQYMKVWNNLIKK